MQIECYRSIGECFVRLNLVALRFAALKAAIVEFVVLNVKEQMREVVEVVGVEPTAHLLHLWNVVL